MAEFNQFTNITGKRSLFYLQNECFNSFTNDDILCSHVSEIVSALLEELKMGLIFHDQVVDVLICVINYVAKNGVKERVSEILDKIFASELFTVAAYPPLT